MSRVKAGILDDVLKELRSAKKIHPGWPDHIVARAAIVAEGAGELLKDALQAKYEPGKAGLSLTDQRAAMRREAVQTAAMAIRFIEVLDAEEIAREPKLPDT
ncbi:hypothetical protein DCC81_12085 [Chitinophaga parva]|uniref:Uncharacterized protein n=1 Tax=Chitinophaga parva TaxID=2169414 RepID=A0A2T7BFI3_9BACT|nr:hypothetical protein [Chitinophaga parva]PUZ25046.1 hypothetical protein DCC81_12085 [Chitinophaga parva]